MLSIFRLGLIAIIVSVVFIPAVAVGEESPHDRKALELLRQFSKTLTGAKTIQTNFTYSSHIEVNRRVRRHSKTITLAIRRPNLLAWVLRRGEGLTAKSDGEKLFLRDQKNKKYTEQPAPKTIAGASTNSLPLDGIGQGGVAEMILSDDPYAAVMNGATKADYKGTEKIEGVRCHKIYITHEEFDVYIFLPVKGESLPALIKYDLGLMVAKQYAKGLEIPQVKAEITVKFGPWKLDVEIPDQAFKFNPPAGVRKVDSFFDSKDPGKHPLLGKAAPDFELDLLTGGKVKLADHKGKDVVILDFWATWCPPCRKAMPVLIDVASRYADQGVVFYAVDMREDPQTIKTFMRQNNVDMPVALDKTAEVARLYGVEGIPQTVLIDKNGKVQSVHSGFGPDTKARLEKELDAILAGKDLAGE